jgi:hypothetical protein
MDVTRECLAAIPDTSISARRVARELTALIECRGRLGMIVSDLVPMDIELLRQLDYGLLARDRGHCYFRLERRAVVPAWSSCHGLLLARSIMPLLRG